MKVIENRNQLKKLINSFEPVEEFETVDNRCREVKVKKRYVDVEFMYKDHKYYLTGVAVNRAKLSIFRLFGKGKRSYVSSFKKLCDVLFWEDAYE